MKNLRTNEKGIVLILTLLYIFLISAFLGSFFLIVSGGLRQANSNVNLIKAYYVADAGLADSFMALRSFANPPNTFTKINANYSMGNVTGSYQAVATSNGVTWPIYTIVSQGTISNVTKTLTLRVQQVSYNRWFYLSNTEICPIPGWGNVPLWWVTGMLTTGPVFTNGQLNILGSPIFDGPVAQVNNAINYYHGGLPNDNPNFAGGLSLGAPPIYFPQAELINNIQSNAGITVTGNTTIQLNADGTMNVTNAGRNWNNTNMAIPAGSAIYVQNGDATVKGTLNGRLTIGSNRNININGNILYHSDPRTQPTSTDMLGLVALQNVIVTNAAPNNLEVDASIVALSGSFQATDWISRPVGNLIQYGNLINFNSGPTGACDGNGNMVAGYNQLQYYDARFHDTAPPFYTPARDSANGRVAYLKLSLTES